MNRTRSGRISGTSRRLRSSRGPLAAALSLALLGARAEALPPPQPVSPFELTGPLQVATLDALDALSGGTLVANGHVVIVPRNTIVLMPASFLTWAELFTLAPAPYGPDQTGMALIDFPAPATTFEVQVRGNRVGDRYVAGLVSLSQQSLNAGEGFINSIDYTTGELRVGGTIGDPTTGARVRLNDPAGRFGRVSSADVRFSIDAESPTVRSETGYPMCVPRFDPAAGEDPECPQANRPVDPATGKFRTIFTMPPPGPGVVPDAHRQAPFEVGDFVHYAGTLMVDGPQPGVGPLTALTSTYVSAWSMIANVGIFTSPGADPAYIAIDDALLGVGGADLEGFILEATTRTRFEGFSTDPTRIVDLFAIDVDPCTGAASDRDWGSVGVDPGPPDGAVKGRWRFRPPSKVLAMPSAGTFLPAPRELRARIRGASPQQAANGILAGQYRSPIAEYIFPERAGVGNPPVPLAFSTLPFLATGSGPWPGGGVDPIPGGVVGQLAPWPGEPAPASPSCAVGIFQPPIADAGAAQTVPSGAVVTLDGSGSTDPNGLPLTYAWTQIGGTPVAISTPSSARPVFVAPTIAGGLPAEVLTFSLVVSDLRGSSAPATIAVTVNPSPAAFLAPIAHAGAAQTVGSNARVVLNGTGSSDPNTPPLALTHGWTQLAGPPVMLVGADTPTPVFHAPAISPGTAQVLSFSLAVTNAAGLSSSARVDVTVSPVEAPTASAGPAQTVALGATVTLHGEASFDPQGLPLSYTWTQVSGPAVTLAGATGANPQFSAPATPTGPDGIAFALTVNNGYLASLPARVAVTVSGPDAVRITEVEYRISRQRLTVNAFSSDPTFGAILTLNGFGGPDGTPMTSIGDGNYTATIVGVAQPSIVTVTSSLGGSATSTVTRLRE